MGAIAGRRGIHSEEKRSLREVATVDNTTVARLCSPSLVAPNDVLTCCLLLGVRFRSVVCAASADTLCDAERGGRGRGAEGSVRGEVVVLTSVVEMRGLRSQPRWISGQWSRMRAHDWCAAIVWTFFFHVRDCVSHHTMILCHFPTRFWGGGTGEVEGWSSRRFVMWASSDMKVGLLAIFDHFVLSGHPFSDCNVSSSWGTIDKCVGRSMAK